MLVAGGQVIPIARVRAADGQPAMTRPPQLLQQGGYQASTG